MSGESSVLQDHPGFTVDDFYHAYGTCNVRKALRLVQNLNSLACNKESLPENTSSYSLSG